MLHQIIAVIIGTLWGSLRRATRLDLDCRHTLAGWPAGQSRELPNVGHDGGAN